MATMERQVFYIFDKNLRDATDNIRNIKLRSAALHSLIKSYKLLEKCIVCPISPASEEDLLSFHESSYIEYLKKAQQSQDIEKIANEEQTSDYNLEYDCPLFENIFDFALIIAGGTLSAARLLCPSEVPTENTALPSAAKDIQPKSYLKFKEKPAGSKTGDVYDLPGDLSFDENSMLTEASLPRISKPLRPVTNGNVTQKNDNGPQKVVLNWFGGWHHAQRDSAEGFCYVNDIVIAIQHLSKFYKRVLYVDLDVHHGNGVENAFAHTTRVMTVSFHKYGVGYYPGTGALENVGIGPGLYHAVNVPLHDGITDGVYMDVFAKILRKVRQVYQPECIVVQCGADCLSGDPLGGFNLTLQGMGFCVQFLLDWKLPTLLVGGGGYNIANAARCYAYLTALTLREKISKNIPDNDFFEMFGPSFDLDVIPSLRKNENTDVYIKTVIDTVLKNLDNLQ